MYEIEENQRPCATHLEVKIYRVKSMTPNFKELKNGQLRELSPICDVAYRYWDSYPYSTLDECKAAIESLKDTFISRNLCTLETFPIHMNKVLPGYR